MAKFNPNAAVAFLRISSSKQRDNTSHETQESEIKHYCQENGLDLVRVIRMIESAQVSGKRLQYQEGISWALKNRISNVVFYIFDRETRNLTDNEANEMLVRSGRIVLHYVRENRVFTKSSPDSDFFLRDVQAVTNKHYVRQLRTKVIDGMKTKAESGWFPGSQPPLGYAHQRLKSDDGRESKRGTTIVIDPNERNVRQVRREFELRAQGYSCAQIRKKVIAEGLIRAEDIDTYYKVAIEKRIRNPFYWGEFVWAGATYQGKHPIIIDQHILHQVAKSTGMRGTQRKREGDNGLFAGGWLTCADESCGCNIVYDPKTKRNKSQGSSKTFHYYHCTNGRLVHATMRGMNVSEEKLWSQFGQIVNRITINEELSQQIAEGLNQTHQKVATSRKREIENYKAALQGLEREEDAAYRDFKKGILTEEMYHRQIQNVRINRREFTDLLEGANTALDGAYLETAKSVLELAKDAKQLWLSRGVHERLDFLKLILSNPRLDGVNVRYDLKKPFGTLSLLKDKTDWWTKLSAFRTELASFAA